MKSIRLGSIRGGRAYEVRVAADGKNDGLTFVFVGWMPAPGHESKVYPMRLSAGQTGTHGLTAPTAGSYYLIEVRIDVPDPGGATLTVTGLEQGERTEQVKEDTRYWMEILS